MSWIEVTGKINFSPPDVTKKHKKQSSWKSIVIVDINDDVGAYYRWFIKKRYDLDLLSPLRGTHLTIINDKNVNTELFKQARERYDRKVLTLKFNPDVRTDGMYWWFRVISEDADTIRNFCNLGEPYYSYHITIGRVDTGLRLEHSQYIYNLIKNFGYN